NSASPDPQPAHPCGTYHLMDSGTCVDRKLQEGPVTRIPILVVAGALGALALTGCAPNGYHPGSSTNLVNATTPSAAPSPTPAESSPAPALTESLISTTVPRMGAVVTDQHGGVLYRFDKDSVNPSKS